MCLVRRDSPWKIDPLRFPEMGSHGYGCHRLAVGTCTKAADVGLRTGQGAILAVKDRAETGTASDTVYDTY